LQLLILICSDYKTAINFINVLSMNLLYKILARQSCVLGLIFFAAKIWYEKHARKTLMKLTPEKFLFYDCAKPVGQFVPSSDFGQSMSSF